MDQTQQLLDRYTRHLENLITSHDRVFKGFEDRLRALEITKPIEPKEFKGLIGRMPRTWKIFVDDRNTPMYVSDSPHPVPFGRSGKWVDAVEKLQ